MTHYGTKVTALKVALCLLMVVMLVLAFSQTVFAAKSWCDTDLGPMTRIAEDNIRKHSRSRSIEARVLEKDVPEDARAVGDYKDGGENEHKR